jgi:hypothetical protein
MPEGALRYFAKSTEMLKRGMMVDVIDWSEDRG